MNVGMISIIGSITNGPLSDIADEHDVKILTPRGMVVHVKKSAIGGAQIVQSAQDATDSLYRVFVGQNIPITVHLSAGDFSGIESAVDEVSAARAKSGARKRIEDTAIMEMLA